jgi:serine/threonine protein phosphatase PrpC
MSSSWCWAGARAIGTAHLAGGLPCQDAFAARIAGAPCGSEILVAALADGAGSAERADAGARLATSLSVEVAAEALADGAGKVEEAGRLLRYAAEQARFAIAALATHEARSIADFASTLLLVVLHGDGGVVAQIGDGAVVGEHEGTSGWEPLLWPDHGEYINTTRFLTDPDALDHLRVVELPGPARNLCLFSDGLERLVLDFRSRTAHAPFFDAVFRRFGELPQSGHVAQVSRELMQLLSSDAVNQRTDDDKSIVCVSRVRNGNGARRPAQEG